MNIYYIDKLYIGDGFKISAKTFGTQHICVTVSK